jgi:two-component system cell cycle response regulator DivK
MSWPASERARVLVVDDHAINLRLTRRLLEFDGYATHTVDNGAAALAAAAELQPDLILADVFLPDMDGHTLVHHLHADPATSDLRVVAFTAAAMESDREAALEAGFDDYLAKPVNAQAFGRFIARQLDDGPSASPDSLRAVG